MTDENLRFAFGKNWQSYLPVVDDVRITQAKDSLTSFFSVSDFHDKTFLDIGSGSGLFSYAASLLGAHVTSFDYDQNSVAATEKLRRERAPEADWRVLQGSALDEAFLKTLGTFDVVYSWGVLHHTGDMWRAIRLTAPMTARGGYYCIALYNRAEGRFGSTFWKWVKERYNRGSRLTKMFIEWMYIAVYFIAMPLLRLKNPLRVMREYGAKRGMHYRRDVADWVGGYPYEYATVEEVFVFMKREFPDFALENVKCVQGLGNNWFLFKRI